MFNRSFRLNQVPAAQDPMIAFIEKDHTAVDDDQKDRDLPIQAGIRGPRKTKAEEDGDGTVRLVAPHKNIALRQHACLTTYYGLRELIEYKFSVMYPGEDVKTVPGDDARLRELYKLYRYDYMDLDGQITAMGYKIEYNF